MSAMLQLHLHSRPGFNGLHKDNCKTRRETFSFWDLVRLILEAWRYVQYQLQPPLFFNFSKKKKNFLKPFSLGPLKLPWIALLKACIWKKNCGEGSPPNTLHIQRVAACPTQNVSSKKKKPKNTDLWQKPCLHVTNPDHKEYLCECRHILMARSCDWETFLNLFSLKNSLFKDL